MTSYAVPVGYRTATVAGRTLRHLVLPQGRFGTCGAPVASETFSDTLAAHDRVCPHCIDRVEGSKPAYRQPAPAVVAERRFVVELSGAVADLLAGTLDPVSRRVHGRGYAATFEIPVRHAAAVADVLDDVGHRSAGGKIRDALRGVGVPSGRASR